MNDNSLASYDRWSKTDATSNKIDFNIIYKR